MPSPSIVVSKSEDDCMFDSLPNPYTRMFHALFIHSFILILPRANGSEPKKVCKRCHALLSMHYKFFESTIKSYVSS
jgi:hypothetical protein